MTDRIVQHLARRRPEALARPSAVALLAVLLSGALAAWAWLLARGGDAALTWAAAARLAVVALPVMAVAAWMGIVAARRAIRLAGAADRPRLAVAVTATWVALAASAGQALVLLAAPPVLGMPRDAAVAPVLALVRDLLAALPVALVVAGLACLRMSRPWEAPDPARWRAPGNRAGRMALSAGLALAVIAPVVLVAQGGAQRAQAAGPSVCPAGAALTTFQVAAIDVEIPLNRMGDVDRSGKMYVLESRRGEVAAAESAPVSLGQNGGDVIQPLVIRANVGECVQVTFTNRLTSTSDPVGMHVDGLAYHVDSSGDAVGQNPGSAATQGQTVTYTWHIPDDPSLEGAHYIRPGPGNRFMVQHGLFGALVVEPAGSTYRHPETLQPISSGWEAVIEVPGPGNDFREAVNLFHEIGDEKHRIPTDNAAHAPELPMKDPHTEAYRPGSRAINYRSEPFMHRLDLEDRWKSFAYSSYTFGDPTTPMPRGYLGDPTKIRILHSGSEMLHVYHLHGGGIRWRANPFADTTFDYRDTGLDKRPKTALSPSSRLDSQSFGPGESFNLEIEGGAGGVQQSAGDFLYHCHIAEHYVAGMWSFWRVFDTRQDELAVLPDRAAPPAPVTSDELIGKTFNGVTLTAENLDEWIRPQLPAQGVPARGPATDPARLPGGVDVQGTVWDWRVDATDPAAPVYAGAPVDTTAWANLPTEAEAGQGPGTAARTSLRRGDRPVVVGGVARPAILFNPDNGRPAYPLLRPEIGQRIPFGPRHGGAPWLGESGGDAATPGAPSPYAARPDAICPTGAPDRRFNVVSVQRPIQVTRAGQVDPFGKVFVLARDKAEVLSGARNPEPLAIRGNIGDCVRLTLTSEQIDDSTPAAEIPSPNPDAQRDPDQPFAMTNIHIHHVQFDVQASDGVGTGLAFGQAVRPYKGEDPRLTQAAPLGATVLHLDDVGKFRPGMAIGVGLGTEDIEVHRITAVSPDAGAAGPGTLTIAAPLERAHAAGRWAGTEFVQYMWYPDVVLDNVFFHDHVDGIKNWGHGLVGQFVVQPEGSTYHDPVTGREIASGTVADIRTDNPLIPGVVDGSFREFVMWTIDENPATDSTVNLRAEPWGTRLSANADPSLLFSSYTHGDPFTPIPRAYRGDPFVIRTINVGPSTDGLRVDGHRFAVEPRYVEGGEQAGSATDAITYGVSERFSLVLQGGAGGVLQRPGDFVYHNTIARRFRQGAWGLLRVLPSRVDDLQPLPGTSVSDAPYQPPARTGGRPPAASPGEVCVPGQPIRRFAVSAVDLPPPPAGIVRPTAVFVPTAEEGSVDPDSVDPLVLHAAAGDCVEVTLTNRRAGKRVSFAAGEVLRDPRSSGINAGFTPEQTVAPGASRVYRLRIDTDRVGAVPVQDAGGLDTGIEGLYGALVAAPAGAWFTDPVTGQRRETGTAVDVHLPDGTSYRDHTVVLFDDDPFIGGNSTPYNTLVEGPATLNYRQQSLATGGVQGDTGAAFAGDPATAVFRARVGDPVRVHVVSAPGSEQPKVASLGGLTWPQDPSIEGSTPVSAQALAPMNALDLHVQGGAGGRAGAVGDTFVGDLRRPFTVAGLWGLLRTLPAATDCQAPRPLAGLPGCPRPAAPVLDRVPQPEPPAQPDPGPAPAPPPAPPAAPVIAPETVVQGAPITPSPTAPPRRLTRAGLPSRLALTAARRRGIPVTVRPDADSRSVRLTLRRGAGGPVIVRRTFRLAVQAQRGRTPRPVTLVLRAPASRLVPGLHVVTIEVPGFAPRTGRVTLVGPVTPGRG